MAKWSKRRVLLSLFAIVALGLVVPPFLNVSRFRGRIAEKIAQAVGRPVTIGSVSLRLFPEPGFNLENVVIADDPALSAEPMLRADEVTATLRLTSLWRGRLEIGKLSLKYPSLNLVRGPGGRWNIESLLEQARRIPAAPTAKPRPEARPRFPYIEANGGRINFKSGPEKKVYALSEADFALWLAAENEWRVRLEARPVRSDSNLSDTGTLKLNGSFQRAWNLRETPLRFRVELQRAQLGQLTNLIYGRDRGWRGAVNASALLSGTPAALKMTAEAAVDDFRRYDILSGEALRLEAHCTAAYSTATELLSGVNCRFPVGDGTATASGSLRGLAQPVAYDFSFTVQDLPAQSLVVLARHVKKNLPSDLSADGALDAAFTLRKNAGGRRIWAGGGSVSDLRLRSSTLGTPLGGREINFALAGPGTEQFAALAASRHGRPQPPQPPGQTGVSVWPFAVPLGAAAPARAQAWFSASGYSLQVQGDAQVQRLLQVARGLGLRAPQTRAAGEARLDLRLAGGWFGFAAPATTGSAQLRAVNVPLRGVAAPLQITSAELVLSDQDMTLQKLAASFSGMRLGFSGWIKLPRGCDAVQQCPARFDLQAGQVSIGELNRLLNPRLRRRPWYDLLSGSPPASFFSQVRASGRLSAARVALRSLMARRMTAHVKLEAGRLTVADIRGELLGGVYRGEWRADFSGQTPAYSTRSRLERASMAQVATAMGDDWATGTADLTFQGSAFGWTGRELSASAAGSVQFDWRDGALAHVALTGAQPPLHVRRFAGGMRLRNGILEIASGRMETPGGIYTVSGTVSLTRQLRLGLLGDGPHAYVITGPLEKPRVALATAPETRASTKP